MLLAPTILGWGVGSLQWLVAMAVVETVVVCFGLNQ